MPLTIVEFLNIITEVIIEMNSLKPCDIVNYVHNDNIMDFLLYDNLQLLTYYIIRKLISNKSNIKFIKNDNSDISDGIKISKKFSQLESKFFIVSETDVICFKLILVENSPKFLLNFCNKINKMENNLFSKNIIQFLKNDIIKKENIKFIERDDYLCENEFALQCKFIELNL